MGQDKPSKLFQGIKVDERTGILFIPMLFENGISFEAIEKLYKLIREPLERRKRKGLIDCETEIIEIGEKP